MSRKHKNDSLRRCQNCATDATEDEGPTYHHDGGMVSVICDCGATSGWCRDMDAAWEAWAAIQAEAVERNQRGTDGLHD